MHMVVRIIKGYNGERQSVPLTDEIFPSEIEAWDRASELDMVYMTEGVLGHYVVECLTIPVKNH